MKRQRRPPRNPDFKPELPPEAELMNILEHVRVQYHPLFLNAHDMPDHNGPRQYLGIDFRCPICRYIQPLGEPGKDNKCSKCGLNYKYISYRKDLWIWKDRLVLEVK